VNVEVWKIGKGGGRKITVPMKKYGRVVELKTSAYGGTAIKRT
jgi:hypothetical protein